MKRHHWFTAVLETSEAGEVCEWAERLPSFLGHRIKKIHPFYLRKYRNVTIRIGDDIDAYQLRMHCPALHHTAAHEGWHFFTATGTEESIQPIVEFTDDLASIHSRIYEPIAKSAFVYFAIWLTSSTEAVHVKLRWC